MHSVSPLATSSRVYGEYRSKVSFVDAGTSYNQSAAFYVPQLASRLTDLVVDEQMRLDYTHGDMQCISADGNGSGGMLDGFCDVKQ
jgi:hypothetical protein